MMGYRAGKLGVSDGRRQSNMMNETTCLLALLICNGKPLVPQL